MAQSHSHSRSDWSRTAARRRVWWLPLALALIGVSARAWAEESTAPETQAAHVTAIPASDIVEEADAVSSWVRDVESELGADVETRIRALLVRKEGEISRRLAAGRQLPAGPSAARELAAARAGWERIGGELTAAQGELQFAADALERRLDEAREREARWTLTSRKRGDQGLPDALVAEVRNTVAALRTERERIERARDATLALEQRASRQRRSVDAALERVDELRGDLRKRLLVRDQPPLWKLRPVSDARAESQRVADLLAETLSGVVDYARRNRDRLFAQLALIALLVWSAVRGRRTLRRFPVGEERDAGVLTHPVAAGVLAGLAPTRAFSPDAPHGFASLLIVFVLPAWLRVLSSVLPSSLRASLRGLAVLVLLDVARSTIYPAPLLARVMLLLELALGAVVAVRLQGLVREGDVVRRVGRVWQRALRLWCRLCLLAFASGLLVTVPGYGELANLLAATPVLGSFMGTALVVAVLVAELLLRALLESGRLDAVHLFRTHPGPLLRSSSRLLRIGALGTWLYLVLDFTTLGDPLWPWIRGVLAEPLGYGSFSITLGGVVAFGLALWASLLLARFVAFVLDTEVFPRVAMPAGIPFALTTFTRYGVFFIGFVIALGMIGFSLDRVTILLSALGVGVGFGLQNVVNNFVSGVILLFERPIRVGDRIELEDLVGDVIRIGLRASRVRTLDGIDLIVPNGDFVSARVANWTLADPVRRVSMMVGVAYGTRPERVIELLEGVARGHEDVVASPAPEVLFKGFGDSSLDFELRVWTDSRLMFRVNSDLAVATYAALEQAGIEVPFPQRDLHLRSVAPEARLAGGLDSVADPER